MGNTVKKHYNKSDPHTRRNDGALVLFLRACLGNFCTYINNIYYACQRQEQKIAFKSFLNQKSNSVNRWGILFRIIIANLNSMQHEMTEP